MEFGILKCIAFLCSASRLGGKARRRLADLILPMREGRKLLRPLEWLVNAVGIFDSGTNPDTEIKNNSLDPESSSMHYFDNEPLRDSSLSQASK